jgi:hypothetical protein
VKEDHWRYFRYYRQNNDDVDVNISASYGDVRMYLSNTTDVDYGHYQYKTKQVGCSVGNNDR